MAYSHVKEIDRYHRDRTYHSILTGFRDLDELKKYTAHLKERMSVYHPHFGDPKQNEDGTFAVSYSFWDTSD